MEWVGSLWSGSQLLWSGSGPCGADHSYCGVNHRYCGVDPGPCEVDHSYCGVDRVPVERIIVTVEWIGFLWSRSQLLWSGSGSCGVDQLL